MDRQSQEVLLEIRSTLHRLSEQIDTLISSLDKELSAVPEEARPSVGQETPAVASELLSEQEEVAEEPELLVGQEEVPEEPEAQDAPVLDEPETEAVLEEAPTLGEPAPVPSFDLTSDFDTAPLAKRKEVDIHSYQWSIDIPGSQVRNIISGISLNDRILLINTLFGGDPLAFQRTIEAFNSMESLSQVVSCILANFPDWDLGSDVVYRLMMAVRRKLRQ